MSEPLKKLNLKQNRNISDFEIVNESKIFIIDKMLNQIQ